MKVIACVNCTIKFLIIYYSNYCGFYGGKMDLEENVKTELKFVRQEELALKTNYTQSFKEFTFNFRFEGKVLDDVKHHDVGLPII